MASLPGGEADAATPVGPVSVGCFISAQSMATDIPGRIRRGLECPSWLFPLPALQWPLSLCTQYEVPPCCSLVALAGGRNCSYPSAQLKKRHQPSPLLPQSIFKVKLMRPLQVRAYVPVPDRRNKGWLATCKFTGLAASQAAS